MKALRPCAPRIGQFGRSHHIQRSPANSSQFLPTNHQRHTQHRTFLSPSSFNLNPFPPALQRLTAHRTIVHPPSLIYSVISDVAAYSSFLPFCQESLVTKYSSPAAATGKAYPEEAKLVIGFNDAIAESFTSRVYCVPERVVEAVSGNSETSLSPAEIAHHGPRPPRNGDRSRQGAVMTQLRTRWTLKEGGGRDAGTEVDLIVEFQFANPLYAAMSSAAAPKVAEKMIEAFEKRVEWVVKERGKA